MKNQKQVFSVMMLPLIGFFLFIGQTCNFLCLIFSACQATMALFDFTLSNSVVGATTSMTVTIHLSSNTFAEGDVLTLTIQSPGSFTPATNQCTSSTGGITVSSCTISAQSVDINLSVTSTSLTQLNVGIQGFINPPSTKSITNNVALLKSSTGTEKEQNSLGEIRDFIPGTIGSASLSSSSNVIGDSSNVVLTVSFTPPNTLTTTGYLELVIPLRFSPTIHMITGTPSCTGSQVLKSGINCTYDRSNKKLVLTNILDTDQAGGTAMQFTMSGFINPDSAYPKSGFSLSTFDSEGYYIDYVDLSITVTDWGTLTLPTISHDITEVNSNSVVTIKLTNPYSVEASCRLRIDFPADMPVTSALSQITGSGYFQTTPQTFSPDLTNNFVTVDGCQQAFSPGRDFTVNLQYVVNQGWVKESGSFTLSLYRIVGTSEYQIAKTTDTITLPATDFTTGLINSLVVTAEDSSEIQVATRYKIQLQPAHNMPQNSKIVITFPSSITMTDGACTLSSVNGGISTAPTSCNVLSNVLTIQDPFGSSGSYTAGNTMEFVLSNTGTNPQVVQDAGNFLVNTFATISSVDYPIDTDTETNVYTPTPAILEAAVNSVSSLVTYNSPVEYVLAIKNKKTIPQNGKITIVFPTEIALASTGLQSCTFNGAALSQCTQTSSSPLTYEINDAFTTGDYSTTGVDFLIAINGLVNPRTTAQTSSFTISTTDSAGQAIESVSTGVTTQMTSVNQFSAFSITPVSTVNGAVTQYKIALTANSPLNSGDILQLDFPTEVTLPTSVTCTAGTSVTALTCAKFSTNSLRATLSTITGGTVSNGANLDFLVNSVPNPPSTKPTSDFANIAAYDSSNNQLSSYATFNIQTTTPATVTTSSISQASYAIGTATTYTITYTAVNEMATNGAFKVKYPTSITMPSSFSQCYVRYNSVDHTMTCSIDTTTRTISVSSNGSTTGLNSAITAGSSIALNLGPITNPSVVSSDYGTFELTSYTDSTFAYTVDNIPSGLSPLLECDYPCQTCSQSNRASCLTCFTNEATIPEKYLYNNQCITSCPTTTYFDTSLICYDCDSRCATCENNNQCLTCDTSGTYPNLYNNYCYATCPTNTFLTNGVCQDCNTNCATCSGTATTCTSCNSLSTVPFLDTSTSTCINNCASGYVQIGSQCQPCASPCDTCAQTTITCLTCLNNQYLYGTTCVTTCPDGTYLDSANSQCVACSSTCATCSNANTCLTCATSTPYLYNGQCLSVCPSNAYLSGTTCVDCNSNCETCTGTSTNCLTCPSTGTNTVLSQANRCVSACDSGYVQISSECQMCTIPCATCSGTQTTCLTCEGSTYLYGNTCVTTCPSNTYLDTSLNQCITCNTKCATCTSSSTCTTCQSQFPYLENGMCTSTCSAGYYLSGTNCVACDSNCATCSGTATNCQSCNSASTTPLLSQTNTCVTTCDSSYLAISGRCVQCNSPCQTCLIDTDTCKSCDANYYLFGSECVTTCPSGYVQTDTKCEGCDPNCLSCSSIDTTACLQCKSSYLLYDNTCYQGCPSGYVADSSNTKCITPGSEVDGTIYVYFPVTITQTVLTGVALGSFLKAPASLFFSSTIALYGGIELIAYTGQLGLGFSKEVLNQDVTTDTEVATAVGRRLQETESSATNSLYDKPVVFLGTLIALGFFFLTQILWVILYFVIVNRDEGFQIYKENYRCTEKILFVLSCIFSYKIARFFYCNFFGFERFNAGFTNPRKIHHTFNCLTLMNIILVLLPIIFIDIYGLVRYDWGAQFYMILVETLLLTIAILIFSIIEFRYFQIDNIKYDPNAPTKGGMTSINEEELFRRFEEKFKLKHGEEFKQMSGRTDLGDVGPRMMGGPDMVASGFMDESGYPMMGNDNTMLKNNQKGKGKGKDNLGQIEEDDEQSIKKRKSFNDPNFWDKERDDRRIATDPTNLKLKPNKRGSNNSLDDEEVKRVGRNDDLKDSEQSLKRKLKVADARKNERGIDPSFGDENDRSTSAMKKRRGRNNKYYQQVEEEDESIINENIGDLEKGTDRGLLDGAESTVRQSQASSEDDVGNQNGQSTFKNIKDKQDKLKQKEQEKNKTTHTEEEQKKLEQEIIDDSKVFEEEKVEGEGKMNTQQQEEEIFKQAEDSKINNNVQILDDGMSDDDDKPKQGGSSKELQGNKTFDGRALEEEILKSKQEEELKEKLPNSDKKSPIKKTTNELENEIVQLDQSKQDNQSKQQNNKNINEEQELAKLENDIQKLDRPDSRQKSELGEPDSDDDEDQRIKNMSDPDKRKFNVHDIMGDLDRDENGNLLLKQNSKGELIDKNGKKVNEKGYLIDDQTGNVIENSQNKKVFDQSDLDERGEIPPPFNLEKLNFNPHDIRGYLDRDQNGNEIIGNRKNEKGEPVDKLGRPVNKDGYLIDQDGNLVDKRGRTRLHEKLLEQGDISQLLNYKGKKYDIRDVIGDFDKDRKGNIIIRRDKDNNRVDKKGRKVNQKGYLVDENGNVINKDGKPMFDRNALSKDEEIPKLFPFLKFNTKDITGEFEMDPLGNPILQKNANGDLVDNNGNRVNEKGYLVDEKGNVINKKGQKVFNKNLLEEDGDIPKVFRSGIMRKDTNDSFNQLMNEIEHLEKMQDQQVSRRQQSPKRNTQKDTKNSKNSKKHQQDANNPNTQSLRDIDEKRMNQRIDEILDGEDEDGDLLMKEIEELVGDQAFKAEYYSNGGNTSMNSAMGETPSNYDTLNQRYEELDNLKDRSRHMKGFAVPEDLELDDSEDDFGGRQLKNRRKKPKGGKKKAKRDKTDYNDLLMQAAYKGFPQHKIDFLKEQLRKQQQQKGLTPQRGRDRTPRMKRDASFVSNSTSQNRTHLSKYDKYGPSLAGQDSKLGSVIPEEDNLTESQSQMSKKKVQQPWTQRIPPKYQKPDLRGSSKLDSRANTKQQNFRKSDRGAADHYNISPFQPNKIMENNLMQSLTGQSFHQEKKGQSQKNDANTPPNEIEKLQPLDHETRLHHVANSVNQFYPDNMSLQSKKPSTHESNIAQSIKHPRANPLNPLNRIDHKRDSSNDPELEKLYNAPGLGLDGLTDWDKDSLLSQGTSKKSRVKGFNQKKKLKAMESIYLQRLEPALTFSKKTPHKPTGCRVMHHRAHDEPEWYIDDNLSEHSIRTQRDADKFIQKKFVEEFHSKKEADKYVQRNVFEDTSGNNIFNGNFKNYHEKKLKEGKSYIDLGK